MRDMARRVFAPGQCLIITLELMARDPAIEHLPYLTRNIRKSRKSALDRHRHDTIKCSADDVEKHNLDELPVMLRAAIADEIRETARKSVPTIYANPALDTFDAPRTGRFNRISNRVQAGHHPRPQRQHQ